MKRKPLFALLILSLTITTVLARQKSTHKPDKKLLSSINQSLKESADQYLFLAGQTPADRLPRTLDKNGELVTSGSGWWCSGFYPGTLLYLYEAGKDDRLLKEVGERLKLLEKEQFNKTTHDLGFMMYCSFGNANRLEPDAKYREILVNSARSLASRFSPAVGCIRSWDSDDPSEFRVIIDNMMNLELLFWAARETGDSSFYNIAVTHANTTLKNHFRPDNSSWHLVIYDGQTGQVTKKQTVQGYADDSAWARGQAWGLYGYTLMFRETKDKKYLEQAQKIASFILRHPNLPADKIPYWDFNAPDIPSALRDASAGAVIASALIELSGYTGAQNQADYLANAEKMLASLSSPEYRATKGTNGGFLLKHSVGHLKANSEVDVPLTYADYYYVEAMLRYKGL